MKPIDISPADLETVKVILRQHVPEYEVRAFGSRVKWSARETSDLDLAIMTDKPLDAARMADLRDAFTESDLPFKVDLVDWAAIKENFRAIIEEAHELVQEKEQAPAASSLTTRTLRDHVALQRGTTYKSALLDQPGPVLLGLASIQPNGGFRRTSLRTYGGESPEKLLLKPGDFYVSLKDVTQSGDLLGAVSRVPPEIAIGRLTQDTVKLIFRSDKAPREYIYWVLRTPQYRAYCRARAIGTTNLSLSRDDFLAFSVPDPTAEQLKLVELLSSLDEQIDLNRRTSETLEAMARAIFKSWFVDFDPVRAKAEGCDPDLPQAIAQLFPDHFDDEGQPSGWTAGTLVDLATLNPETWRRSEYPEEINYIDLSNTKRGSIEAVEVHSKSEAPSRAQRILRPGDTIVGTVRPGNESYALIGMDGLTGSTGFAVLRPKQPHYREMVYLAATSDVNIERMARLADGGAYPAIRPEAVMETQLPGYEEGCVKRFSDLTSPMFDQILAKKMLSRTLAQVRDTLLPKLLSGEIRIKDAERLVEEHV